MTRLMFDIFRIAFFSLIYLNLTQAGTIYDFIIEDHDGTKISLNKFYGKATLIVNVASHCGYTDSTYPALTRLHDILGYGDYFSVLAFPCNQFGEQEPDNASEVLAAMQGKFEIEFPIFNKIDVVGHGASPFFRALIDESGVVPDWNFYKYLVSWKGEVLNAWSTTTTIEEIFDDVQSAVEEAKKAKSNFTGGSQEPEANPPKESKDEL